jgi:hypothetical protein
VPRRHRPPYWLDRRRLHHPCTLALVDVPDASHRGWSPTSWSLDPSLTSALHRSRSISTTHLYLTFSSSSTTASEFHTCIIQAKRHVVHIAFIIVGLVTTQSTLWITLTITHHKTNTQGYLSTLCLHCHNHTCWSLSWKVWLLNSHE